ncbi:DUF1822 family protein [Coleofasciculus sp. FACHB-712]|uniref:DUF1822 family protein n=1 Tax=Coleofasciculus sp. FACHB-712 TaxID=2692789 RepID=UPI0016837A73|nr:DUF1822 family protein [Coleofasciculus sp. FACHB-712]MBD1943312.1 DUF1822 family protein [Coleofasciculus sp. FACHB-712]
MNSTAPVSLNVPLSDTAHQLARQFAQEQATPEKGVRVYLNTLAVWAVHRYLKWLRYEPDLTSSDSWHPGMRAMFDVADLVLPNLGRLECRPVLPGETSVTLPPEVMQDRVGYVAVQFGARATPTEPVYLQEAHLIGFAPAIATENPPEELQLADLQSLDALMEYLDQLESALSDAPDKTRSQLNNWLQNFFESGWQTVEEVLTPQTPLLALRRSTVRRAKRIELETNAVVLIVTLQPETPERLSIHLQVCSVNPQITLPHQLKLMVLTESGEVFREIIASGTDTFMQYEFRGQVGEQFSVKVALGDTSITEAFVI